MSHNEGDTCRLCVEPKLKAAGWEVEPHRVNSRLHGLSLTSITQSTPRARRTRNKSLTLRFS